MKGIASVLFALLLHATFAPGLFAQKVAILGVSCAGSTCPSPVELVDGQPVTIGLRGSGLGEIVSGQVTAGLRGLVVDGVTVELGPVVTVRRTMMRDATVTARGARSLTHLELRFATRTGASVTAPIELSIAEVTTAPARLVTRDPSPAEPDGNDPLLSVEESIEQATPSVTGANPTLVKLWAAGAPRTIVLEGSALDRLTGARVRHAGQDVVDVLAEVGPASDPGRREISLSARESARVPWGEELEVVAEAPDPRFGITTTYPTPVRVVASGTVRADDRLFVDAINEAGILFQARASFNSCGPPDDHRFSVAVPALSHGRAGSVERLERVITPGGAYSLAFLEDHSLDPLDPFNPQEFDDFDDNRHPSPIPHTLAAVRMCLADLRAASWRATGVDVTGAVPRLILAVEFADALFRVRGLPVPPPPLPPIPVHRWGDPLTDRELPDLLISSPRYEVRLPMGVSDGRIQYGSPDVTFTAAPPRWSGVFLGPSRFRDGLARVAADQMKGQIEAEVGLSFAAQAARNALAEATWSKLQTVNVSEILGLQKGADGTLRFAYE